MISQGAGSGTCTGPAHIYLDDDPSGTDSDPYTVTIEVTDDDGGSGDNSVVHWVNNVAPMITGITTNGPVPQGQPVTIIVNATDVGINDILSYAFDCDNDGSYEVGPQASNQADCTLDPEAGASTIGVRVEDDDLGEATGSVEVIQQVTLCLNPSTGAISEAGVGGSCGGRHASSGAPGALSGDALYQQLHRGAELDARQSVLLRRATTHRAGRWPAALLRESLDRAAAGAADSRAMWRV